MARHGWAFIAWIGAALAVPIQAAERVEGEFVQSTATELALVETGRGMEVVALEPGAALLGLTSLRELRAGDRIAFSSLREEHGVSLATSVELLPSVTTTPELRVGIEHVLKEVAPPPGAGGRSALVDLRSDQAFARGHLPGAISASGWKRRFAASLPPDKEAPLVLYGDSRQDAASVEALRAALLLGYRKARLYVGGYREWSDANRPTLVRATDLAQRLGAEPLVVLDVRPKEEAARGALPRSVSIVPAEMRSPQWTERPAMPALVLMGRDAGDTVPYEVAETIRRWQPSSEGIPRGTIQILEGGFAAWVAAGGKVEKPQQSIDDVPCIPLVGEICAADFLRLWREGRAAGAPLLLDVRNDAASYRPAWARHVPIAELTRRLSELPREREIVVFCARGITSRVAQAVLERAGFKARFVRLPAPQQP